MGPTTSADDKSPKTAGQRAAAAEQDDDEPDECTFVHLLWRPDVLTRPGKFLRDKRIFSTGCADENAKLTDCYYDKKDWRACKDEMERFRQCWKAQGNDRRTGMKDA